MKPMIILPPDTMTEENIKLLRENDICVVVAKDPSKVRFVDPIPAMTSRTEIESAAIKLSRILLNKQWGHITQSENLDISDISRLYIGCLTKGTPLDREGPKEEQEARIFDQAKAEEIRNLAREEARAERAAKKAKAAK